MTKSAFLNAFFQNQKETSLKIPVGFVVGGSNVRLYSYFCIVP
jgi:hypothetical protein